MSTLTLLKWRNKQKEQQRFYLIKKVSSKWSDFGCRFEREENELCDLNDECRENAEKWRKVMQVWLDNDGAPDYPASWEGVVTVLEDVGYSEVARQLETVLASVISPPVPTKCVVTPLPLQHVGTQTVTPLPSPPPLVVQPTPVTRSLRPTDTSSNQESIIFRILLRIFTFLRDSVIPFPSRVLSRMRGTALSMRSLSEPHA